MRTALFVSRIALQYGSDPDRFNPGQLRPYWRLIGHFEC
jgi:hypothetical protein